jgi:hypothetical protein
MRATFFEMHLLNDTSQVHDTSFIWNRKEWGRARQREKKEKERENG